MRPSRYNTVQRTIQTLATATSILWSTIACGEGGGGTNPPPTPTVEIKNYTAPNNANEGETINITAYAEAKNTTLEKIITTYNNQADTTNNNRITTTFTADTTGTITIEAYATGATTDKEQIELTVKPKPTITIQQIQNNETNNTTKDQATIRIYSPDSTLLHTTTTNNGTITTTKIPRHNKYIIQTRTTDKQGKPTSYIRTITTTETNENNINIPLIRIVPYDSLKENNITPKEYATHACQAIGSIDNPNTTEDESKDCKIYKLPPGSRVYIAESLPEKGRFTAERSERLKNIIEDASNVPIMMGGHKPEVTIGNDEDTEKHYTVENGIYKNDEGWIVVFPDSLMRGGGLTNVGDGIPTDGIITRSVIYFNVSVPGPIVQRVINHEFGHAAGMYGHPTTLPEWFSVMRINWVGEEPHWQDTPGLADYKTALIIYEETFNPLERVDKNILGLEWIGSD